MPEAHVEFRLISKRFAGVTALENVSLAIARGECHGLMGENGAGKSTLGKILAGIHRPDAGRILIDGREASINSPTDALRHGIGMVHQELAFCPDLSVAENLCMGQYPRRLGILVDRPRMHRRAERLLGQIGVSLDVTQPMRALSTAQEQLVQIASAIGTDARILIFDEPTSSLSEPEAQRLFELIQRLKSRGVTMIYISHRMPELFRLCDRISVLRDGRYVGTLPRDQASPDTIVRMMIGRSIEEYFPQHLSDKPGPTLLSVRGLRSPGLFEDVSFEIRSGEIVGFAGLVGAGRSEVARAIFGLDPNARGQIELEGRPLRLGRVRQAMRRGIGLLPEDRKRQGLVLAMSGRANLSLAMLDRLSRLGLLAQRQERAVAQTYFQRLAIRAPSIETPVQALSGGNQQKVAIGKWLARGARLLILDEPTRGVDVGAKAAIHRLIDELARQGAGIMLVSSELPEVLNLSTRILVMRQGRIVGELTRDQADQETVLRLMAGVERSGADRDSLVA
ncbi:sugar ABC transporter ATP-binding protein [Fontivita pretiosa]|uniref:sugar ABC transporter ATP-binding protein n=1 Tax=Fontivita pretiosa TaxID=2989684 RepID=UPI003D187501